MIPIKLNNNNPDFNEKYKEYNNIIACNDYTQLMCSKISCQKIGQFERNTSYERNCIYIKEESFSNFNEITNLIIIETKIIIIVLRCKACGKYHALLPTFILPYHIYSAYFIIYALVAKLIRNKNIQILLLSLNISHKLFYYWIKIFNNYINLATVVLKANNNDPPSVLNLIISDFEEFLSNFYNQYFFIFFLNTDNHVF